MAKERRQPRQPDRRKREELRSPGRPGKRKPKEAKPFQRDPFQKRKGESKPVEDQPRKDKGDLPLEKKRPYKGRDERSPEKKGPYKGRDERSPEKKGPYKGRDERSAEKKGPYKGRDERSAGTKGPYKGRDERSAEKKGPYKGRDERSEEKQGTFKRKSSFSEGKGGYKAKPMVKKYTGTGKKEGDYIPKGHREEEAVRLNKYIANAGVCSRREADDLIKAGVVTVNGKVVTELGTKVLPSDKVVYGDQLLSNERKRYILLNKQKGYVTTTKDPHATNTVMELIAGACKERVYPVGRLDRNSTGLLLFTNDGELSKKLTHPSSLINKLYHVVLDQPLKKADLLKIAAGIELDDGLAKVDSIAYDISANDKRELGVEIHSGKNRVIRRIFAALDYKVVKLDRTIFAGLTKKNLPRGRWRHLTDQEVRLLKRL